MQPENFQDRWDFVELGHFNKHFIKSTRKNANEGIILEFFLLDILKTLFWNKKFNSKMDTIKAFFPKN